MKLGSETLISRAELIKRVDRKKTYVYKACQEGGELFDAMVGEKVDLSHPAAIDFCRNNKYKSPEMPDELSAAERFEEAADDSDKKTAADIMNMTLSEIVERYGKMPQFKEYVQTNKIIVETRGKEEEQERKRGEYIHRVHAERLIGMIDALSNALLSESTVSISTTVTALVKSGAGKKQIERSVHDVISRTIKTTKSRVARSLRDG